MSQLPMRTSSLDYIALTKYNDLSIFAYTISRRKLHFSPAFHSFLAPSLVLASSSQTESTTLHVLHPPSSNHHRPLQIQPALPFDFHRFLEQLRLTADPSPTSSDPSLMSLASSGAGCRSRSSPIFSSSFPRRWHNARGGGQLTI